MKTFSIAAAALIGLATAGSANAATIAGLYNTGVADDGTVLGQGVADTHYALNGSGTAYTYNNGAYAQAADATYLAAQTDGNYSVNPNIYTLTFDLGALDPTTASLNGLISADNGATISLNGHEIGSTGSYSTFTAFGTSSFFQAGQNVLSFSVLDSGPPSAFAVSGLSGTASAISSAVPEPASWAMMIGGVGFAGGAMRRKRTVSAKVAFA